MTDRIIASTEYPRYWQYGGKPVLLLGGSVEDNLFQIDGLEEHLDTLRAAGGNYVRCTMSSRDEGNVWPFEQREDGLYDLEKPGREYWDRFRRFCDLTAERDVIAQIELWDRFDFARDPWQLNPYNPKNNVNFTAGESGLVERIDRHPSKRDSAFFRSVPALENHELLLGYQRAQVRRLLEISLDYPNLLYCMDNETNEDAAWGAYWAGFVRAEAEQRGVGVELTEMWDAHDLNAEMHDRTILHPETYTFVDVSQNNHQTGRAHWDNLLAARARVTDPPRPCNNVKVYGADGGRHGDTRNGIRRFWRSVMGGSASVRFHRPPSGLGLGELAQAHIRSARMLTDAIDVFTAEPANDLLTGQGDDQAYCRATPSREAAVLLFEPGPVTLNTSGMSGELAINWLDIENGRWLEEKRVSPAGPLTLDAPLPGMQAAVVRTTE